MFTLGYQLIISVFCKHISNILEIVNSEEGIHINNTRTC